jgi:hypothetical protein
LLGLQVPAQSPPPAEHFLLDAKATQRWFEALPMANIGETARQIFRTLIEFNRMQIPDPLRARTVEKFRPPVEYIVTNLQKHYVELGLPLSRKGLKTAALARQLENEMAMAYKIVIERTIGGDSAQFDRRLLVVALHRALYYLGETLLQNALVYVTWPDGVWREINAIYAYASQNQIDQVPIKSDSGAATTSIEDLFKGLMLFASATPHRLRQSHTRLLYNKLSAWTAHTRILTEDDGGTSLGRFNVDLWTDSAPLHNSLRTPMLGKRTAILDVRDLLTQLRDDFEQAPWDSRSALQSGGMEITRPFLRLLIMAWSRPPDRRFVRTRLNFDLQVVAGLHAIYANLSSDDPSPYPTAPAELFTLDDSDAGAQARARAKIDWTSGALDKASLAPLDSELIADSLFNDSRFASDPTSESAAHVKSFASASRDVPDIDPDTAPAKPAKPNSYHVTTINESAGGYCIRWKDEDIPKVKIGELIGIEAPTDARKYGLGVVRWMQQFQDETLNLGLEVIATRCQAGDVHAVPENPRRRGPSYKCLVINDSDASANGTASLVMSAMNLDVGVDLVLTLDDREQTIRLTRLIEFSCAFARYLFELVQSEEEQKPADDRPDTDFDDLWGTL